MWKSDGPHTKQLWYSTNNIAGPEVVTQIFTVLYGNEINIRFEGDDRYLKRSVFWDIM